MKGPGKETEVKGILWSNLTLQIYTAAVDSYKGVKMGNVAYHPDHPIPVELPPAVYNNIMLTIGEYCTSTNADPLVLKLELNHWAKIHESVPLRHYLLEIIKGLFSPRSFEGEEGYKDLAKPKKKP